MNRRAALSVMLLVLAAGVLGPLVPAAGAQYFGRNKVRYEDFDYKVLRTEHFDIYYYPEEREAVHRAALLAERWYGRLTQFFGHEFRDRQPLVLYASQSHFQQTTVLSGDIGEGTGGATEALRRRIVLPFAGLLSETDHVLGHELVHAFQFDITTRGNVRAGGAPPGALYLPLWFIEGMAEYVSLGPIDPNTAMWLRDATIAGKLPTVVQLDHYRFFPYRYGQAFWSYVAGRWGDPVVGELLRIAAQAGDWRVAVPRVLGIGLDSLSADWHAALHQLYDPIASQTKGPGAFGAVALPRENDRELTLAPVLSPDGSRMAFISERNRTSLELFVADVATGEVRRKLTKAAVDPHLESLQFITSAGSWAPDGRRFAFAAVSRGQPLLSVIDVERGRTVVERSFAELDQIFSPTWSPDGRWVAFSASVGGQLDLFAYDLEAKVLERLTNDAYGELHPAWSPDGRSIAFVTDRFSTDLDALVFGRPQLALLDRSTGAVRPLPGFDGAKHTNPQWAADGRSLFFLSDRGGITDVYRLDLPTDSLFQITNLQTGVSGITALSPALSAAQRAGRLAFSVFERGRYRIYAMDSATASAGQPVTGPPSVRNAAVLPPVDRVSDQVLELLADSTIGLPADREFVERDYSAKLGLEYLAPPSVAGGIDQFGGFIGGSTALFWSDLLGTRSLVTSLFVNGRLDEFAALVGYINQRRRLSWGVSASQIPFVSGLITRNATTVQGNPAIVDSTFRFVQFNRDVSVLAAYPFSQARRVELGAGFRNLGFSQEVETVVFDPFTGAVFAADRSDLPAPQSFNLGEVSAALVYDNTLFGGTGPVLGQRYRLEVSPQFGSLNFAGALVDWRRYFMPVRPVTLAFRLLHFGRYGPDAENPALSQLYLGSTGLVRGYDIGSFETVECGVSPTCPVFDQLLGSRVIVGNAEVRYPLLRFPLPLDFALFGDAGIAWQDDVRGTPVNEEAFFLGGDRRFVGSVGAALRINVLGALIIEAAIVRPLDRPQKGWLLQWDFTPAF